MSIFDAEQARCFAECGEGFRPDGPSSQYRSVPRRSASPRARSATRSRSWRASWGWRCSSAVIISWRSRMPGAVSMMMRPLRSLRSTGPPGAQPRPERNRRARIDLARRPLADPGAGTFQGDASGRPCPDRDENRLQHFSRVRRSCHFLPSCRDEPCGGRVAGRRYEPPRRVAGVAGRSRVSGRARPWQGSGFAMCGGQWDWGLWTRTLGVERDISRSSMCSTPTMPPCMRRPQELGMVLAPAFLTEREIRSGGLVALPGFGPVDLGHYRVVFSATKTA